MRTRALRAVLIAAAFTALAVGFLLLCPGGNARNAGLSSTVSVFATTE
jgi:hypothetical protein